MKDNSIELTIGDKIDKSQFGLGNTIIMSKRQTTISNAQHVVLSSLYYIETSRGEFYYYNGETGIQFSPLHYRICP